MSNYNTAIHTSTRHVIRKTPYINTYLCTVSYNTVVALIQRRIHKHWDPNTQLIHFRQCKGGGPDNQRIYVQNWHTTNEYPYPHINYRCNETKPYKQLRNNFDPFQIIRYVHHDLSAFLAHVEIPEYWQTIADDFRNAGISPYSFRDHTIALVEKHYMPLIDNITTTLLEQPATEPLLARLNMLRTNVLMVESIRLNEQPKRK